MMSARASKKSRRIRSAQPGTEIGSLAPASLEEFRRRAHGDVIATGSRNVFADFGMSEPDERLLKAKLLLAIQDEIRQRSAMHDAEVSSIAQADLALLERGHGARLSVDRLSGILRRLGFEVEFTGSAGGSAGGSLRFRRRR